MPNCQYCKKEMSDDRKTMLHERFCNGNPNAVRYKGKEKVKEVVQEAAKKLEQIDTSKEAGKITQKQHDIQSTKAIEKAIKLPEIGIQEEDEPKGEKNPLILLGIVVLIIIIAVIIFFRDEVLERFFPKNEEQ